eukprot:TRINITY_DN38656_c0_g1_i1.p1 TRINITY_DN38656_c0_g1~~TRINITY_DN38656_c0_g1_i1.p1  ORF type:complete len:233 (+),score=48.31 TRINITY_DN38656_c0_g1_i1:88-786(+)
MATAHGLDDRQRVLEMQHRQCVEELFDSYADDFDQHLVQGLRYDIPNLMCQQLPTGNFERCLDLGCGTGLAGVVLRPRCGYLEGVDLAERMVEKAEERGLYDKLASRDLVAHLRRQDAGSFDLLVATDVVMYVYSIAMMFQEAARVLRPGGVLAFSTEVASEEEAETVGGVVERTSERYAHARSFILARTAADFRMESVQEVPVRLDGSNGPIMGDIFVFTRMEASADKSAA